MVTGNSVMAVIRAYRPTFRNPHDKVAFAVHASFLASGFILTATGPPAFSENALSSSSDEVGIQGWNESDDSYTFLYLKEEKGSKKSVLVKCLAIGDDLMVDVLIIGNDMEPLNSQINVDHYNEKNGSGNYNEQYKNFNDLVKKLKSEILTKLDCSQPLKSSSNTSSSSRSGTSARPDDSLRDPAPEITEPYPSLSVYPPVPSFGGSDLYPGSGAGVFPSRGSTGIGSGMLLGPNDPRWFGGGEQSGFPGGLPVVPPGARFDPYGPPGVPGFEPNRFARNPRRGPGMGNHPDLEHFGDGSDIL